MAKAKKDTAVEPLPQPPDIFEHFGEPEPEKKPEPKAADPNAALIETLGRINDRIDRIQDGIVATATAPAPVKPLEAPTLSEMDMTGLPDQVDDPVGYQKGLNDRIANTVTEGVRRITEFDSAQRAAETAKASQYSGVFTDFKAQHYEELGKGLPEDVDLTDYVEVAAKRVMGRVTARGGDVDAYMTRTRDTFFRDVIAEANKILGPMRSEDDGKKPDVEDADHRTGGLIGDTGTGDPKLNDEDEKASQTSLIDDIQAIQVKTGFH